MVVFSRGERRRGKRQGGVCGSEGLTVCIMSWARTRLMSAGVLKCGDGRVRTAARRPASTDLLRGCRLMGAKRRMSGREIYPPAAIHGVEISAAGVGYEVKNGVRHCVMASAGS